MKKLKKILVMLVLFTVSVYGREFPSANTMRFAPKVSDKAYMQTADWKRHKMFKALGVGDFGYWICYGKCRFLVVGVDV